MARRRNLNQSPAQSMAEIVRKLRDDAQSSKTGSAGVTDLGENGDVVWTGTDANGQPVEHTVRRFQVDLDDTSERADQLEEDLEQAEQAIAAAQGRLDTAEQELGELDMRVDDAARNAENKVVNPGFEAGFESWIGSGGAGEESVDTSRAHAGAQSLRLVSSQAATQALVPVREGQIWEASAWFLYEGTESGINGGLRLQRSADGTTWVNVDSAANVVPSVSGWQQIRHDYVVPAGVAFIRARAAFSTFSGTVWVDDFSLRDVTSLRAVQQAAAAADAKAVAAQKAAEDAQDAAEQAAIDAAGKARVVYSDTPPAGADDVLWFDTANANVPKVWQALLGETARRNELLNPFGPTMTALDHWYPTRGDVAIVQDEGRPVVRFLQSGTGSPYYDPTARVSPSAGTVVRFSVDIKVTHDTTGMRISVPAYGGAALTGNTMPYTTQLVADGWVRYELTVTITAMPAGGYIRTLIWPREMLAGQGFFARNAAVEYDTSGPWFDGSTAGARWSSTPNGSASVYDGPVWRELRDEGVQQAIDAAAAAMAEARYAPRIADRAPTAADGASKPVGAGWLEYDEAGLLIQMWRWSGTAWERLDMDPVMIPVIQIGTGTVGDLTGDRVTVTGEFVARVAQILELSVANLVVTEGAVINELVALAIAGATAEFQEAYIQNLRTNGAVIDEAVIGDLAANIITSGLFRTSETGQRWEIDSNGIVMYGVDDNGADYELVRLGPSGTNLITVGKTTVAPESIASPEGYFSSLAVGGLTLAEHLAQLPRGVVAWGQLTQNSDYDSSNTLVRRAELQVRLEPGRIYRIKLGTRYLQTTATAATFATEFLHYSWDGTPIIPNNIGTGVYQGTSGRQYVTTSRAYSYPPLEFLVDTGGNSASRLFWCMYSIQSATAVQLVAAANAPVIMSAEDLGPSLPGYLKRWNDNNAGGGQDPGPAPVQRYKKEYVSTGFRCYNENGTDAGRPDVVHGLYPGGPNHLRRRGGWLFPSMTGDLAGATIEKIRMYVTCTQTYSSGGSTVNLAVWGGVMAETLTTFTSRYGWKAGTPLWIDLPASLYAGFKSGQYAGVGVKPTSYGTEQYARFAPTGAKIEITYTK